jgi:hypothetical protein
MVTMLKKILAYFGRKSHNVQVQLLCATLYGLISLFGIGGTIAIIMKARKVANTRVHKPCNRVTVKKDKAS